MDFKLYRYYLGIKIIYNRYGLITFNRFITLKQTKIPFTNKSIFILVYKRKSIYVYSSLAIKTVTTPVLGIIPNHNNKLLILY